MWTGKCRFVLLNRILVDLSCIATGQTEEISPPLVSPVVADDNWGNVQNQQNENGVPDVQDLDVWKPKPEAVEAEEETNDIPDECYKLENEIGKTKMFV